MGWWRRMTHPWRTLLQRRPVMDVDTDEAPRIRKEAERKLAETKKLAAEVHKVSQRIERHQLLDNDNFAKLFDTAVRSPRRRPRHQS